MTLDRVRQLVTQIQFRDWLFDVDTRGDAFTVRVAFMAEDHETKQPAMQFGRRWDISQHAIDAEVVSTCLKAVLTALEHEAREEFLYMGRPIYGPHMALGQLWLAADPEQHARRPQKV